MAGKGKPGTKTAMPKKDDAKSADDSVGSPSIQFLFENNF